MAWGQQGLERVANYFCESKLWKLTIDSSEVSRRNNQQSAHSSPSCPSCSCRWGILLFLRNFRPWHRAALGIILYYAFNCFLKCQSRSSRQVLSGNALFALRHYVIGKSCILGSQTACGQFHKLRWTYGIKKFSVLSRFKCMEPWRISPICMGNSLKWNGTMHVHFISRICRRWTINT